MEETNSSDVASVGGLRAATVEGHARKLPIESGFEGQICVHCGSRRYSLVFRVVRGQPGGRLSARCNRCRGYRAFVPDHLMAQMAQAGETGAFVHQGRTS